jgi:putative phage-type endonuclease
MFFDPWVEDEDKVQYTVKARASYYDLGPTFDTHVYVPYTNRVKQMLERSFFHPNPVTNEKEHHAFRYQHLTASNVAAVLGLNPYQTRQKVYEKYTNPQEPSIDNYFTRRGRQQEPYIARKFTHASGLTCLYDLPLVEHPTYPWLGATFDLLTNKGHPVEIKYLISRKPTEETFMPMMYWVQMQIQLQVAQSSSGYYVEFKSATDTEPEYFKILIVSRDDDWFAQMFSKIECFWQSVQEARCKE